MKEGLDIRHKSTGKQPNQALLFIIWCSCLKAQLAQIVVFPLHHTKPACAFPHARTHTHTHSTPITPNQGKTDETQFIYMGAYTHATTFPIFALCQPQK